MSSVEYLREFVSERLTAAAEEIFRVFKQTFVEYEEEIGRQRKLLDIVYKPEVKLHRIELPQQHVCKEEEDLTDQQLCNQERKSSLDQREPEPPQIKEEEEDELCTSQQGEHLELLTQTRIHTELPQQHVCKEFVSERLTAAAEEIFRVFKQTVVEYEEEIRRQRKLLDMVYKPEVKLHRIELPQQHVCKEEEVLADQQLCNQERNSSLDQEEPEPPQIKEEEEDELCTSQQGEQLELKQETDISMLIPPYEEGDDSEDQASYFNPDETLSAAGKESVVNKPVKSSVEPNSDLQPLSNDCHVAESQDQTGDEHGDSGSTRNAESQSLKNCFSEKTDCNSELNRHMKVHAGEKPCVCESCGKRFDCKSALLVHMRIHTSEKQFICKTCGKGFRSRSGLFFHMKRDHTGERSFVCKICRKDFIYRSSLVDHMISHTSEKQFICKTCGKDFKSRSGLFHHRKRAHPGEKQFICKICGQDYTSRSSLVSHMRVHTDVRPYNCETCGKCFSEKGSLRRHMRIHTGEKPYNCKTCGKCFFKECTLTMHMRIHTGERPYNCKTCGKDFRYRSSLLVHMKRAHTGEKPFVCKTCGKDFTTSGELKSHMRVHTGERPYNCKTCGKCFLRKSTLTKHMRIHTGEKPFICITCGKDFSSSSTLSAHKKITHSGQETVPSQGLRENMS